MTSASAAIGKHGVVPGLLDRPSFDVLLILSTVILAMTAGTTAWLVPALFMPSCSPIYGRSATTM